jgi:hypothetical protein
LHDRERRGGERREQRRRRGEGERDERELRGHGVAGPDAEPHAARDGERDQAGHGHRGLDGGAPRRRGDDQQQTRERESAAQDGLRAALARAQRREAARVRRCELLLFRDRGVQGHDAYHGM